MPTTDPTHTAPADGHDQGLREPLSLAVRRRLRRAVVEHARTERRRDHPVLLHAGEPGRHDAILDVASAEPADPGLRTDLVAALLVAADLVAADLVAADRAAADRAADPPADPLLWLTRPGDLTLQDVDVRWLAAARAARLESGRPLTMVVVNRRGWRDPRSGLSHSWVRLRLTPGR